METSIIDEPPSQALVIFGQYMQAEILTGLPIYLIYIGVILVLLLTLSALISGSEVAYFSINLHELDELKKSTRKTDERIVDLLATPKFLLATILILNNFVNVAIVTISTYVTWKIFEGVNQVT